jgi:uncharacterized damage-inducible protein DinB
MVDMVKWIRRRFPEKPDAGTFPMVIERLAGTPARIDEMIAAIPPDLLNRRVGDEWSIQEHIGHLWLLEELWSKRLDEFLAGSPELTAADMSNRRTYEANLNGRPIGDIARSFRTERAAIIDKVETLDTAVIERESLHPRLQQPMRLIDLCGFVAEHDDHHLALMSRAWGHLSGSPGVRGRAVRHR